MAFKFIVVHRWYKYYLNLRITDWVSWFLLNHIYDFGYGILTSAFCQDLTCVFIHFWVIFFDFDFVTTADYYYLACPFAAKANSLYKDRITSKPSTKSINLKRAPSDFKLLVPVQTGIPEKLFTMFDQLTSLLQKLPRKPTGSPQETSAGSHKDRSGSRTTNSYFKSTRANHKNGPIPIFPL